jgi:hypothetical protein
MEDNQSRDARGRGVAELQSCVFETNQDFVLGTATAHNHRNWRRKGEEFSIDDSTYADNTAALFASREDCEVGVPKPKLTDLMARFGGEVHARKPGQVKASKSVVLFLVSMPRVTLPLVVLGVPTCHT